MLEPLPARRARRRRSSRHVTATAIVAIAGLALAAPAAADGVVTLQGADAAGPDRYDKVTLIKTRPSRAENVLVLAPGTSGGAAYFQPVAEALVRRLPGWQVWSVERRENRLEDHSVLDRAIAGKASSKELFDYYLGWLGKPDDGTKRFRPKTTQETAFARRWGMGTAVGDLRKVVLSAKRRGGKVVLGGHSLGGSITTAYASWDFRGRPGVRDLDALVYIDGASAPGGAATPEKARADLDALASGSPFLDLTGLGLPWSAGVFNAVGSTSALREPDAPSRLQSWPLLPASLKPPVPATNAAGYGYALDTETGPANLRLVQMNLGRLAPSGTPRRWVDGGLAPVARAARLFSGRRGIDGTAWYHPRRLSIDAGAVNGGIRNPAQSVVGSRAIHGRQLKVPLYAITTSLGGDRVLDATRAVAKQAGVPRSQVTLVDRQRTYAHIDPLSATPAKNDFVRTIVPFLKRVAR